MTRKLFWDDPYQTTADAVVVSVDGAVVTLDRTIIYAFSGGQESDQGTIAGWPVLDARKAGTDIAYRLADDHGLRPGDAVALTIDWPRRYNLMRLHFAAELVLELVGSLLPGIEKIGAHIAADKARIDFTWPQPITAIFPALAARAAAIIAADQPIVSAFSDPAAGRRYWAVAGFAQVPCGGTHLRRTGEVGPLQFKRRNIGKGKERIEISLAAPS